jgi:hypothetical protein
VAFYKAMEGTGLEWGNYDIRTPQEEEICKYSGNMVCT